MTTHKLTISSILTALLLTCTAMQSFATNSIIWTTTTGISSAGVTDAQTMKDVNFGTDTTTNQYVFQMDLKTLPSGSNADNLNLYGIYLGGANLTAPKLGAQYPTGFTASTENFYMIWGAAGTFYNLPRGSSVSASFTTLPGQNALEWRINTNSIPSSDWFYGAISTLNGGTVFATTTAAPIAAAPIPAAAWLLGSGIIGLIGIRRRNQKRAVGETQTLA
jgi:hypothetical protein